MLCHGNTRKFGLWLVIALGIAAAAMSSGKPLKDERPGAVPAATIERTTPHVSVVLPLLAMM